MNFGSRSVPKSLCIEIVSLVSLLCQAPLPLSTLDLEYTNILKSFKSHFFCELRRYFGFKQPVLNVFTTFLCSSFFPYSFSDDS